MASFFNLDDPTLYTGVNYAALPAWSASTAVTPGNLVVDANGNTQRCSTAGTTGSSAPSWGTAIGAITNDGSAAWTLLAIGSAGIQNDPGSIQSRILAQLKAQQASYPALQGVEIMAFPDDPESWRAINDIGTVLVRYDGSQYGAIEDTQIVAQERKMRFKVGVLARGLGWSDAAGVSPQGAYAILNSCLSILLGYKVPGARMIYADEDNFVRRDREGGVWVYALDIVVVTYVVAQAAPETIPTFTEGAANLSINEVATESVSTEGLP
jgi:hypothetical protein